MEVFPKRSLALTLGEMNPIIDEVTRVNVKVWQIFERRRARLSAS